MHETKESHFFKLSVHFLSQLAQMKVETLLCLEDEDPKQGTTSHEPSPTPMPIVPLHVRVPSLGLQFY